MKARILTGLKKRAKSIMRRRRGRDTVINKSTSARRPGRRYQ
ncbi:hypothetical protein SAMN05444858_101502 [Micromonospora avicenniae]|uniref:Uncharacterized protein n=1 Tax=Micromonospora avicenniae TaxID=1198245 RepID=A0A1N6QW82_9ACTN|nr:hypothetical protein SAMN05444858_101502 [Micromonospora avicenniae]